jgi:hypothetical protein
VIAPESAPGINTQAIFRRLLLTNLLGAAFIFVLLEIWRPFFFLTDDNLDGALPWMNAMGRQLLAGQSPFVSHHVFGGDYNCLRDAAYLVWHPVYLLVSLLAGTPFHNAIIDTDAFVMLMVTTAGFTTLAVYLRRELDLALGDRWITFYTLSFVYTMIAMTTGASWFNYLCNESALPWLTLGILLPNWRRGVGLVALFSVHQVLGGHLLPTVSDSIFLSFFALGMAISRRSAVPMINWLAGYAIAIVVVAPFLLPILDGFSHSLRAGGTNLQDMQNNNVPALLFAPSIFLGLALPLFHHLEHPYITYTLSFGASAAVWCLLPALCSRAKWRGIEVVALLLMVFAMVLVIRPLVITKIMIHLPLFRSMRWPFRELVQFQFFLHLFLLVRPPGLSVAARKFSVFFGAGIFVIPLFFSQLPPTLNAMTWDRELVLGDGRARYWAKVLPLLKPTDRVAVIIPLDIYRNNRFEEPYSLLGTYEYAEIDGFVNAWGYSPTAPLDQVYTKTYAYYPFGAYRSSQKAALMAEKPDLKFITLESLFPLKITLSSRDGPTLDLTPFVPERKSKIPADAALLRHNELPTSSDN